ncbi:hypothetical protein MMAG44476_12731 [Mycolicibacterium mageritense DSM 44476 = CIP 104973]|uniref:Mce protein n=1 Tax=Mycolicibacterium mageritense TaxID=53462 RepID=A0ABM7HL61_MYCME|nr:hypothetical protein [Mycolicibacterium mageritense]MCC9182531.1 Mce protein [Mycolicibacterium mageritense]BBX31235.1 hypothetical protein MMAGJ_05170 [Mycolicibacterium mageritense]CDO24985.1 Mce associated membrane protein [Mycolicibacterium mageritense DSM 44476 = CIP 104973]
MAKHADDDAPDEPEATAVEVGADDEADSEEEGNTEGGKSPEPVQSGLSPVRLAAIVGVVVVVLLAGLTGWLAYRADQSHRAEQQRELFLQAGRQGALNLTSIDWQQADADVQRVLDSATGTFYDDFSKRAQPFVEVVKQAKSKSVGTIAEAGVESETDGGAQILVAVTVNTSNAGAPQQAPRAWRMLLTVQQVGDEAKVSNVKFVP